MSWLVDLRRYARNSPNLVGPGRLILVVGPSGAGKDTLIDGARRACASDSTVVIARRVITRPASSAEDNATVSEQSFNQSVAEGAFAMWWDAHGHRYGIPAAIDEDIRKGRTVICNVSRTIVGLARKRFASVVVVLVTAPKPILQARLASRLRTSDGDIGIRIGRTVELTSVDLPDIVIQNVGSPDSGIRRLLNAVRDPGIFVVY